MSEIAVTTGGTDITRGYLTPFIPQQTQDTVLLRRGGGDMRLYRELLRDDQVFANLNSRRKAVVAAEWDVDAGGSRRIDRQAADSLKAQLSALDWDDLTEKMLYGEFYGYAVAEALYARDGREVVLDNVKVRERRRFGFDGANRLRLLTTSNPTLGDLLPDRKFWAFACGADNDDEPFGLGLAHFLYWPVFFKRNGVKFWLIFQDKFGMPTGKGSYPDGATDSQKKTLLEALKAIQTDSGIIVPENMAIELLEASRSGTDSYGTFYDRMNTAISKVILGHSASAESTPGRLGADTIAETVRDDLVKASADLINGSFNRQVARWLTEWNYPGAAVPVVSRRLEPPEDLTSRVKLDQILNDIGYRPTQVYIRETYGGDYEFVGPPQQTAAESSPAPGDTKSPQQKALLPGAQSFAESSPTAADLMTQQLAGSADVEVGKWLAQIETMLSRADSLAQFREHLLSAYDHLPHDQLAQIMAGAFAAAEAAGRFDVENEG